MNTDEIAIAVQGVHKSFKLPHEQHNGIKQLLVNFRKRKKGFENQHVLKGVSFEIKKGEFFGIVGRNGSGKSTLLKLLAAIYTPDKGHIQVNGSLTPFIELGVGFNPELTGRENVYMNGALLGFSNKQMDAMYDEIVDFAELERFMDQKLKNYSSGMQVRLAFSIAIRADTDILVLDEVLAVGDSAFQQKCFDYFKQLREANKTIILVTHDMSAVNRFCDRAIYISQGEIQKIGTPGEISDLYLLENLENSGKTKVPDSVVLSQHAAVDIKQLKREDDKVVIQIDYSNKINEDMYVAMSLINNGMSVGEITTPMDMEIRGEGKVIYNLDTTYLNASIYQVTVILCRKDDRHMLAVGENRLTFAVKGSDITRGATLKMTHDWEMS